MSSFENDRLVLGMETGREEVTIVNVQDLRWTISVRSL